MLHRFSLASVLLASALASPVSSQPAPGAQTPGASTAQPSMPGPSTPSGRLRETEAQYPPWQRGENNSAVDRGLEFTVAPVDVLSDFHGSIDHPDLVLYVSGNYFFAVRGVVDAFE